MDLRAALQREEFAGLTDQEALDLGNEIVVIGGSDALWSYGGVATLYGGAIGEALGAAISAEGFPIAANRYANDGLQLSLPEVQGQLAFIGGKYPALTTACNDLREVGVTHGTRWQLWGVEQPSVEDITAARVLIKSELELQSLSTHYQAVIAAWRAGEILNVDDALTAIAAYPGR